jgi:hypothetical protein
VIAGGSSALNVLITNIRLDGRTGTELYVRDVAIRLLRQGHRPMVYSPLLGPVADELRHANIPVISDLSHLGVPPAIIHGHHNYSTVTALLQFPRTPAVAFCHDAEFWHDAGFRHPNIRRYVAVDYACRDRLIMECGIAESSVQVLLNAIDLQRFAARREALPDRPRRALVFSNAAPVTGPSYVRAISKACRRAGIKVDVVGLAAGNQLAEPEAWLSGYDLVFAKARCAMEAMASGAAVILCDTIGMGSMVTADAIDDLRPLNFGRRTLTEPVTTERIEREIRRYSAADATRVAARIRQVADLDLLIEQLLVLYGEVLTAPAPAPNGDEASLSAAAYLQSIAERVLELDRIDNQAWVLNAEAVQLRREQYDPAAHRFVQALARRAVPSAKIRAALGRLFGCAVPR